MKKMFRSVQAFIGILLIVMLVLALSSCSSSPKGYDPANTATWFDENGGKIALWEVNKIEMGMTYSEMVEKIGLPRCRTGGGMFTVKYDIAPDISLIVYIDIYGGDSGDELRVGGYALGKHTKDEYFTPEVYYESWYADDADWENAKATGDWGDIDRKADPNVETVSIWTVLWKWVALGIGLIVAAAAVILVLFKHRKRVAATPTVTEE